MGNVGEMSAQGKTVGLRIGQEDPWPSLGIPRITSSSPMSQEKVLGFRRKETYQVS